MPYNIQATAETPALIIYLLDVSVSMNQPLGRKRRVDVVSDALRVALRRLIFLSTKSGILSPRYRIAMLVYSDHVYELLNGIETIDQVARKGVPNLQLKRDTDTAHAFEVVEKLLQRELPSMRHCPAPLICHMTDGEYIGADPELIVRRIMDMRVPDGNVLVENIFVSDSIMPNPIADPKQWAGVLPNTTLVDDYAKKLRAISSPLPESYRMMMLEDGYHMAQGALMMLPGMSPELVEMGFVMSTATPVAR